MRNTNDMNVMLSHVPWPVSSVSVCVPQLTISMPLVPVQSTSVGKVHSIMCYQQHSLDSSARNTIARVCVKLQVSVKFKLPLNQLRVHLLGSMRPSNIQRSVLWTVRRLWQLTCFTVFTSGKETTMCCPYCPWGNWSSGPTAHTWPVSKPVSFLWNKVCISFVTCTGH